jgi:hypothetical protein
MEVTDGLQSSAILLPGTAHCIKNAVFPDVTPCGSWKKEHSASIIRVTIIGELGDGGAKFLRNVGSYKSHTS